MTSRTQIRSFSFANLTDSSSLAAVLFEAEGTKMICKVKAEVTKDPLLSSRRNLKARVSIAGDETANNETVNRLENVLSQLIPADSLEKIQLQILFEVLSLDGNLIDYCTNLAVYTLMQGNVPLRDSVASCTCTVSPDGTLAVDPTAEELLAAKGKVRITVSSQKDKIADFELQGVVGENEFLKDCLGLAVSGAKAVSSNVVQKVVARELGAN